MRVHCIAIEWMIGCVLFMMRVMLLLVMLLMLRVMLFLVMLVMLLLVMLLLVVLLMLVVMLRLVVMLLVMGGVHVLWQVIRMVQALVLLLQAYLAIQNGLFRFLLVVVAHILVAVVLIMMPVLIM
jgi:hypothetical protein